MRMRHSWCAGALAFGVTWAGLAACGTDDESVFRTPADPGADGSTSPPVFGGEDVFNGPWSDFPKDPIVDSSAGGAISTPTDAPALFASGTTAAGDGNSPCLLEPEVGSLVPENWLRPRFRWTAAGDANLFEIRVNADNQKNDLVVYTTSSEWTMPNAIWDGLRAHSAGVGITLSVRGGKLDAGKVTGITSGSSGPWGIAPAEAPGSIVYWRIIGSAKADLKGFVVGDDNVRPALDPSKVEQNAGTECVGCHISSPDGKFAIFSSNHYGGHNHYGLGIASIEPATEGKKPDFLTAAGKSALESHVKGVSTVSAAHWGPGKHLVVASHSGQIRWVNLDGVDDATARGVVALTGDTHSNPNSPNLSHDGTKLAYVSSNSEADGRPTSGDNDIYVVPFNGGAGGSAVALTGAATTDYNEYYPSFSPDDRLIAFNRVATGDDPYSAATAEVFVVSAAGGTAKRLAANDPPACSGKKGPGVENSWPKWAPAKPSPVTVDGKTYYWLVFSSTRFGGGDRQLFMAPVVVDAAGTISAYKAVYLWNQPAHEKNHTPAWDMFAIPPSTPK